MKSNRIWSLTTYFSQSLFYTCIKMNSKYLFNLFIYRLHFAYPTTTNNEKVSSLPIIEYLKILLNAEQSFNRFVTCSKQMLSCYTLLHQLEDSCSFWIQWVKIKKKKFKIKVARASKKSLAGFFEYLHSTPKFKTVCQREFDLAILGRTVCRQIHNINVYFFKKNYSYTFIF